MPWNALLPILVASYWFLHRTHRFRFGLQRLENNHLLFRIAIGAIVLGVSARVIAFFLQPCMPGVTDLLHDVFPVSVFPYSGTAVIAVALAECSAAIINLLGFRTAYATASRVSATERSAFSWPPWLPASLRPLSETAVGKGRLVQRALRLLRDANLSVAVERYGTNLERLIFRAGKEKLVVAITLSSRKVYVGYIVRLPTHEARESDVGLIPIISGFRRQDTMQFAPTTDYAFIHSAEGEEISGRYADDHTVVFPCSNIHSASMFDLQEYYERFASDDDSLPPSTTEEPGDADQRSNAQESDTITE